jgi:hypothetical protein
MVMSRFKNWCERLEILGGCDVFGGHKGQHCEDREP